MANWKGFLIAPSQYITAKDLEFALQRMTTLGYEPQFLPTITNEYFIYAGTVKKRVDEIHQAFKSKEAKIIFAVRGGHGLNQLLPYLDKNLIKENCKPIVGYSDITILLNYVYQLTGKIMYHGPNLWKPFPENDTSTEYLLDAIAGKDLRYQFSKNDVLVAGVAEGIIVGGNLALLIRSMGTPFEIQTDNKIIFLEATDKDPWWLYDSLEQLKQGKKFTTAKAIILGSFNNCPEHEAYLFDFFKDFKIPIIMRQNFGHKLPNHTIPIGGLCNLNTDQEYWTIRQVNK